MAAVVGQPLKGCHCFEQPVHLSMTVEAEVGVEVPLENAYSLLHLLDSALHHSYVVAAAAGASPAAAVFD